MDKFTIDREFGQALWVDVEHGIVQRCYNETPKFNKRMNELYKGKSISFLKTDFEARMKPAYHNVRPESTLVALHNVNAVKSRIRHNNHLLSGLGIIYNSTYGNKYSIEQQKEKQALQQAEKVRINDDNSMLNVELQDFQEQLEIEKERLVSEHNYKF